MNIRKADEHDIPAIVSLLKVSLGEDLMPKSEVYWRWKHVINPFGSSPVLVAEDDSKIIGVRAFMTWEWKKKHERLRAVRAVDTATHPDYQGKGIFRKLTLQMLVDSRAQGYDFVYNTPNSKSKPGYLKMGWQEAGNFPIGFQLARPFTVMTNLLKGNIAPSAPLLNPGAGKELDYLLHHHALTKLIDADNSAFVRTNHTPESLRWRYVDVPVARYEGFGIEKNGALDALVIYRIKENKYGREMRITDAFLAPDVDFRAIRSLLSAHKQEHRADYVTMGTFPSAKLISKGLYFATAKFGPAVTVLNLNMNNLEQLIEFKGWHPSLGDLELF
jgi:N-acetylglutamate synthase-like GNAT family acetyltransferase